MRTQISHVLLYSVTYFLGIFGKIEFFNNITNKIKIDQQQQKKPGMSCQVIILLIPKGITTGQFLLYIPTPKNTIFLSFSIEQ